MKLLARFPALDSDSAASCAVDREATAVRDDAPACPRAAAATRRVGGRLPGGSITALAILAAIVWSLASWNDARRLERSRQERLAAGRLPAATQGTVAR